MCYLCVVTLLFYLFQLSSLLLFSLYWGSSIINSPVFYTLNAKDTVGSTNFLPMEVCHGENWKFFCLNYVNCA